MSTDWTLTVTSDSPARTKHLAAALAPYCGVGDIVLLSGDLGVGKTAFAQGFAAGLGVVGPVTSPTFALVRQYRCGEDSPVSTLIHADIYRTGSFDEVVDLALAELVEDDAVAVIEWGDLAAPAFGDNMLEIAISVDDTLGEGEPSRTLRARGRGTWVARAEALGAAWSASVTVPG
ncbi:MAG TPA: tRNA (adenosine(37)-N6)-threonylcarbamoyltransferase complex ATPase subunit type 1 TsaE [Acidimicrobiales bacterium]|jgi:tRNA threonylcarbamoyladenosine biosynthesis protein TsaE